MKAAVRSKYGPPSVLSIQEIARPIPKDDEVLVRVYATTVNRTDCAILWGKPFFMRFFTGLFKAGPTITGTDFAGKVEAIGKNVTSFQVGDRVMGFGDMGSNSHAQYLTFTETKLIVSIPDNISYDEAAACLEGVVYAFSFTNRAKAGQKVLVNGASGAIGSAAVQLLKYRGVIVTAVCNTKNIDRIKSIGADKVIDYLKQDFTTDDEQYNFIFDTIAKSTFSKCKHLLLPGGAYAPCDLGPGGASLYMPLLTVFANKKVIFPIPRDIREGVLHVKKLVSEGKFKPLIDRKYPLEKIAEAYAYVVTGEKTGNVIITMTDNNEL